MIVHSSNSLVEEWGVEIRVVPYILQSALPGAKSPNVYAVPHPGKLWSELHGLAPHVVILKKLQLPNRIAAVMAKLLGARLVVLTNQEIVAEGRRPLSRLTSRALDPRCRIYTAGDGVIGSGGAKVEGSRITVLLPYPVDPVTQPIGVGSKRSRERIRILMVGAMSSARKRHTWLTRAVASAGLEEDVEVTYVGTGRRDSSQALAIRSLEQHLGLSQSVMQFNVPHSVVMESYTQFDLLVMPAKDEPFGAVVAEALAHGVPVICSSTCGARSCVEDGVNGLVFDSDSFDDFQSKLAHLVRNPSVLTGMGRQARVLADRFINVNGWGREFDRVLVWSVFGMQGECDSRKGSLGR